VREEDRGEGRKLGARRTKNNREEKGDPSRRKGREILSQPSRSLGHPSAQSEAGQRIMHEREYSSIRSEKNWTDLVFRKGNIPSFLMINRVTEEELQINSAKKEFPRE